MLRRQTLQNSLSKNRLNIYFHPHSSWVQSVIFKQAVLQALTHRSA